MSRATESALADPQRVIANLQQQLDERMAERDALRRELADAREQQTATAEVLEGLCHGNVNEHALRAKTSRGVRPRRQRCATVRQLRLGRSAVWIGR